jgi:DNA polymerase III subunit delta'
MAWSHIVGQKKQIEILRRAVQSERLPNAYLFVGQEGIGKDVVALELAKTLNCTAPDATANAEACEQCESCRQFENLAHSNLELVFPIEGILSKDIAETGKDKEKQEDALERYKMLFAEKRKNPYFKMQMEKSMGILAEQIEELIRKSLYRPSDDKKRVYIISQPERMNTTAANRLLKLLEEPPAFVLFVLVSSRPDQLLPTIVSRCQPLRFSAPAPSEISAQLKTKSSSAEQISFASAYARGNVAQAEQLLTDTSLQLLRNDALDFLRYALSASKQLDMIRKAESFSKKDRSRDEQLQTLDALLLIFQDALRVQARQGEAGINSDISGVITKFAQNFPDADFAAAAKAVEDAMYQLTRNANATLLFAALAITLKKTLNS